jgi:polar amino acid transport system substrate-binding protein
LARHVCSNAGLHVNTDMNQEILQQLAPTGTLRAALNMSNFLLVSGKSVDGEPQGVAREMAQAIADRLGVKLRVVPYPKPGELADTADTGAWDIGLIGAEPARAEKISFTSAYVEIEATYLVPPGSPLRHADEVDRPGNRIAVLERSAYDLWLVRHIRHATLVHGNSFDAVFEMFRSEGLEAMASLKPKLLTDAARWPGSRILEGKFTAVQQSVGTSRRNVQAAAFLQAFVEEAKAAGWVAQWIAKHGVQGLSVAPPAA